MSEPSMANDLAATAAELKRARELLTELVGLVDWWAPKDGVPRTAEARNFLGLPCSASEEQT